ncbi:MAG: YtxH domain-containing protein [Bryobacterales bacterium]|nr:YtxH domain-containing protein [Bryobacteraceae bacterium]MDW8131795.1 YtxH domain-containing protein [Bryobacterales bacterium]
MSRNAEKLLWFLIGVALGAGVALLYAPKSGKETRRYLRKKTTEAREALVERGEQLLEKGRELGEEIAERGRQIYRKGVELAEEAGGLLERGRRLVARD